jgi:hypothetical protein
MVTNGATTESYLITIQTWGQIGTLAQLRPSTDFLCGPKQNIAEF